MNTALLATMGITRRFPIPTGYLFVGDYSKGSLETLSIGDYGKRYNVKAEFLGYGKDIERVIRIEDSLLAISPAAITSSALPSLTLEKRLDLPQEQTPPVMY